MDNDFDKILNDSTNGVESMLARSNETKRLMAQIFDKFQEEDVGQEMGLAVCKSIVFYLEKIKGIKIHMDIIDSNGVVANPEEKVPDNFNKTNRWDFL